MIVLHELTGTRGRRFSPNCWRTRMALAHKGLAFTAVPTRFTEISSIADGKQKTVPVIEHGERVIGDSWVIANYLEENYPDRSSLFGGKEARALTLFVQNWAMNVLHPGVTGLILLDIYQQLEVADKPYFRTTREKRFGRSLEDVQAGRDTRVVDFRKSLEPVRQTLKEQPWLGGDTPLYADYLVFGAFQWARLVSRFPLLDDDDPVAEWFGRCLGLFNGLGRDALSPACS